MQEVKELFSHQEGDQVVAKAGLQKPVIALIVACGQIVAGKGSATELQQAPVSVPSFMTICSNHWLHCIIQPHTLHAVSFTIQLLVSCWCILERIQNPRFPVPETITCDTEQQNRAFSACRLLSAAGLSCLLGAGDCQLCHVQRACQGRQGPQHQSSGHQA